MCICMMCECMNSGVFMYCIIHDTVLFRQYFFSISKADLTENLGRENIANIVCLW